MENNTARLENFIETAFAQSSLRNDAESEFILHEVETHMEKIINALPKQWREIYLLNKEEDLSYSQIAKKLNINVGTVKTQMSRAFKKLKIAFSGLLPKYY